MIYVSQAGDIKMAKTNWWTTQQLADAVGVTYATVVRWIDQELVKARRATINPRSQWLISEEEANRVIALMKESAGSR
jgi:hypothetical protein